MFATKQSPIILPLLDCETSKAAAGIRKACNWSTYKYIYIQTKT